MSDILIPTEPDWDGTPMSRSEEILYSIIHTEEWDGTPMSRGEYFLVQLKDAVENISMMDIKGTVPTVADLPATGNKKGDVYSVGPEEQLNKPEYYWDGEAWQYLGQIVDLSGYLPLTGGTMTGDLNFSIGGKTIKIGVSGNETQIISGNTSGPLRIASQDIEISTSGGRINLTAGSNQSAVSINQDGHATTKIWGGNKTIVTSSSNTEISADGYTTIKGHQSNNTDTNVITLNSSGITETTLAKKVVTTATGIELGTTSVDNTVSVSTPLKKLSVSSPVQMDVNSGGNLNVTGYGNVNVTATAGSVTEFANGNFSTRADSGTNSIYGKQGVDLTAGINQATIGYVTATHGITPQVSDSSNKVATTAMAHAIANSKIGTVPFGTCSSAADAVAKTVTVTNFPGLVDGATINVLFENANTATNPTLNVNESGAQPIMRTSSSAAGTNKAASWDSGSVVTFLYVQNTGWTMTNYTQYHWVNQYPSATNKDYRVLISSIDNDTNTTAAVAKSGNLTFNPSTKRLGLQGKVILKSSNLDARIAPAENKYSDAELNFYDLNGDSATANRLGYVNVYKKTDNTTYILLAAQTRNVADTANITNSMGICINRDGTRSYTVADPSAFRDAIGLGSVLSDISSIQATIGDINTVLEEVL